jgi:hypothetical protein
MRFLNYETQDKAQQAPERMHLEWVDAFTQLAKEGPGRAIRTEREAQSAREQLEWQKHKRDVFRDELRSMREAERSTNAMRNVGTSVNDYQGYDGFHPEVSLRQRDADLTRQVEIATALVNDLEARLEDWTSGKPLPPPEPVKVNPAPEGELDYRTEMAVRKAFRRAAVRI